jgi:hypothetical protein
MQAPLTNIAVYKADSKPKGDSIGSIRTQMGSVINAYTENTGHPPVMRKFSRCYAKSGLAEPLCKKSSVLFGSAMSFRPQTSGQNDVDTPLDLLHGWRRMPLTAVANGNPNGGGLYICVLAGRISLNRRPQLNSPIAVQHVMLTPGLHTVQTKATVGGLGSCGSGQSSTPCMKNDPRLRNI